VTLPAPIRGLVIRHAFLWSHEKAEGREEGSKDRPAIILLVMAANDGGDVLVGVVPVTHTKPEDPDGGLEIPADVRRRLGLDAEPQWVVFDEVNRFVWPGYDLRRVPRTDADSYGMLPQSLFDRVLKGVLDRHKAKKVTILDRN
jgi:hypothetical protein